MKEGWNSKKGRWASNAPAIEKRAREARVWLRELGEKALREGVEDVNIVVVTHGGFLHYFTDDVCILSFYLHPSHLFPSISSFIHSHPIHYLHRSPF